jgi:hypothetical protein
VLVLLGCGGAAALKVLLSLALIPIPYYDQPYFFETAHRFANNHGLTNPFFSIVPGNPRALFIWHGWLYPWMLGFLPSSQTYARILFAPTLIACAASFILINYLRKRVGSLSLALAAPAILAFNLYAIGRPENLICLLLCAVPFLMQRFDRLQMQAAGAVLLGLAAVTQPAVAALCVPLIVLLHGLKDTSLPFFTRSMLLYLAVTPLTILLLTDGLMDFSVWTWINGLSYHAKITAARQDSLGFSLYYLRNEEYPLVGVMFLLALALLVLAPSGRQLSISGWMRYGAGSVLWLAGVWYCALRIPALSYNVKAFGPLMIVAAALMSEHDAKLGETARYVLRGLQVTLAAGAVLGLAYGAVVDWLSYRKGVSVAAMQSGVARLSRSNEPILIPHPFVGPVSEVLGPDRLMASHAFQAMVTPEQWTAPIIMLKQAGMGQVGLPRIPANYRVIESTFHDKPVRLFGLTIKKSLNDWAYAILCRADVCAEIEDAPAQAR